MFSALITFHHPSVLCVLSLHLVPSVVAMLLGPFRNDLFSKPVFEVALFS